MRIFTEGVGLLGPGLSGWETASAILAGAAPYAAAPVQIPPSELLPPAERRRTVQTVKLALAVGREALLQAGRSATETATVFTSSGADGETIHQICEALAQPEREVSPTRFHNSVHNAPAGYWSIATRARTPSTSLCVYDASFGGGLLEAAAQSIVDDIPVLLIAYDLPYSEPLCRVRAIDAVFAVALLVSARRTARSIAQLQIDFTPQTSVADRLPHAALETLRTSAPAARSLPLLCALARREPANITLEYLPETHLRMVVEPC